MPDPVVVDVQERPFTATDRAYGDEMPRPSRLPG